MNFDDTPQEAEFRDTARKWIDANAPKEFEAELSKPSLGRIRLAQHDMVAVGNEQLEAERLEVMVGHRTLAEAA